MTDKEEYQYDVAFSFLKEDEAIVYKVNDLIQDRVKTFLYSKNQEGLVGFDGEEKFHEVFTQKSRFVVIFFRQAWGQTPWTRIEMTAIKNRSLDNGYDFAIFVPLDGSSLPIWIPKTRIWFDLNRWGPQALASLIESKLSELGVELKKEETAIEYAKRKQREIQIKKEIDWYLQSEAAYSDACSEFSKIFEKVKAFERELKDLKFSTGRSEQIDRSIAIRVARFSLSFSWVVYYQNSLTNSFLLITIKKRANDWEEREYYALESAKYNFQMNDVRRKGWMQVDGVEFFESEPLVEKWTKDLLRFIDC